MGPTYDILIADDHPLFRSALRQALNSAIGSQLTLTEVGSISELQRTLEQRSDWDLVLLDLNMPGAYGFSGLVLLRSQYPQIPVVVISAQEEADVVQRARDFGASGFIPKSSPLELLQQSVREVLEGGVCWPPIQGDAAALTDEQQEVSASGQPDAPAVPRADHGLRWPAEQTDCLGAERLQGHHQGTCHGDFSQARGAYPYPGGTGTATYGAGALNVLRR